MKYLVLLVVLISVGKSYGAVNKFGSYGCVGSKVQNPYFKIHFYKEGEEDKAKIYARITDVVRNSFKRGELDSRTLEPAKAIENLFAAEVKFQILGDTKVNSPHFAFNSYQSFSVTIPYELTLPLQNKGKGPEKFQTYAIETGKYYNTVLGEFSCERLEPQP